MGMPLILAFVLFAGMGGIAIGTVGGMRVWSQQQRDAKRRHYVLTFPRDLSYDAVLAFIRALAGITVAPFSRIGGLPSVVFEVRATPQGIRHQLSVPVHLADFVVSQLRGQIPGINAKPLNEDEESWDLAVELRMTSSKLPLRIGSPEAVVNTLLSSFAPLKDSEAVLLQWVVAPAIPEKPGDDKRHKEKLADHTFLAVPRLAARAEDQDTARRLMRRVFTGLSSTKALGVSFKVRQLPKDTAHKRVVRRSAPITFPCLVNAHELTTLIAIPFGSPRVPGLPQGQSRQLAPDPSIPTTGLVLGTSNFPGSERPIAISPNDLLRHLWIAGPTGTGKSTALHNLSVQLMNQGYGFMQIEPKGDLVEDTLRSVPQHRIKDVILFDPTDAAYPIGLNILSGSDPERITSHIVSLFKTIYGDSWGPRLEYILRYALLTAALNKLSLYDVKQLLLSPAFRRGVVRRIKQPDIREFWQWFERTADNAADSVVNKLDAFLGYSVIRNIVGQTESGFDMNSVIREGKILLVPLSSGLLGDANSSMLGSLIISQAWQAARGRAAVARRDRQPYFMIIDEFQNYLNLPVAIGDALAQARGYSLGLVLANQHQAQLKPDVRAGVMANARSKIVYQTAADDARSFAHEFAPHLEQTDLQTLGRFEAVCKLLTDDVAAPPVTAYMPPPPRSTGSQKAVRAASREAYGRPVSDVEADFASRHRSYSVEKQMPNIGREASDD